MKKAVIIYHSKTGITRWYADEIGTYLKTKEIDLIITDLEDFKNDMFENVDYIFLGCWTHGLFIILQHPKKEWKEFAAKLPDLTGTKITLFTTYKVLTGSMFKNMYKQLKGRFDKPALKLKSRKGILSENDKISLQNFIS